MFIYTFPHFGQKIALTNKPFFDTERKSERKIPELECLICGKEFRHLGSHIPQKHQMTTKIYKIKFGLDISKGLITKDIKEKLILKNSTSQNLKNGEKFRFIKNDPRFNYKRSQETLERLSKWGKNNKKYD